MRWLACVFLIAWCCVSAAQLAPRTQNLAALSGQWQVTTATVSSERADRLLYQVDDPRLVGRFISFSADQITSDLREAFACK
jgi:hypothetical protein